MSRILRAASALLASLAGAAALWIAGHHPVAPWAASVALLAWFAVAWRWPTCWLFVLPALLPVANFAPWTGWIAFEEFDLLVLGAIAAGHARLAAGEGPSLRSARVIALLGLLFCLPGVLRGIHDAGVFANSWSVGWSVDWFGGYLDPLNTWRVAKSALYALAVLPLIERDMARDATAATRRLALGMLTGLAIVALAVLWERAAYPGLLDIGAPYRITALFWEMHVGGAAIDSYFALAVPFVAWALWATRSRWRWAAGALLALLVCHACLVTFSRGVYGAVALPLVALGLWLWARRWLSTLRWRTVAASLLCVALAVEVVAVLLPGSFMTLRMARSARDYDSRLHHWQQGIALLHGPQDWLLGLGLGRLPANYARFTPGGELSGSARVLSEDGRAHVRLTGPNADWRLAGLFGLTQQVPLVQSEPPGYRLRLELRNPQALNFEARVCESHLLYDGECQVSDVRVAPSREWRSVELNLIGVPLDAGDLWPRRAAVLTLTVPDIGSAIELRRVSLMPRTSDAELLANPRFEQGLARWLPSAQYYFLPWHIDNLFLELLIERGLLGLLVAAVPVVVVLRGLLRLAVQGGPAAAMTPFLVASLSGGLLVGVISSWLDVPRVAFLAMLLLGVGWQLGMRRAPGPAS